MKIVTIFSDSFASLNKYFRIGSIRFYKNLSIKNNK
jgi:hypothetical protein